MDSKRRGSQLTVSLFPFLSILCCVIGALTLLLAGLAAASGLQNPRGEEYLLFVGQKEKAQTEYNKFELLIAQATGRSEKLKNARTELAKLEQYVRLINEKEDVQKECTSLESLIAQATALSEKLEKAKAELERWEKAREEAATSEKQNIDTLAHLEELRRKSDELRKEIAKIQADVKSLREQPEGKTPDQIVLQPSGTGRGLTPHFVECVAEGIWLDPELPKAQRTFVKNDDISKNRSYRSLLDTVKKTDKAIMTLLIRKDGVESFRSADGSATQRGVRHGYMPVPGDRIIDFSLFKQLNK